MLQTGDKVRVVGDAKTSTAVWVAGRIAKRQGGVATVTATYVRNGKVYVSITGSGHSAFGLDTFQKIEDGH
jgi:hypothetical protein